MQAQHMLQMNFESIADREAFAIWYIDGGGEDMSGFEVMKWTQDMSSFQMQKNPDCEYPQNYLVQIECEKLGYRYPENKIIK